MSIIEQPKDLRAAVVEVVGMAEAMKSINIVLRAAYAEKLLTKTAALLLALVDRIESLEARKKP